MPKIFKIVDRSAILVIRSFFKKNKSRNNIRKTRNNDQKNMDVIELKWLKKAALLIGIFD